MDNPMLRGQARAVACSQTCCRTLLTQSSGPKCSPIPLDVVQASFAVTAGLAVFMKSRTDMGGDPYGSGMSGGAGVLGPLADGFDWLRGKLTGEPGSLVQA